MKKTGVIFCLLLVFTYVKASISVIPQVSQADYYSIKELSRLILINDASSSFEAMVKVILYDEKSLEVATAQTAVFTLHRGSNSLVTLTQLEFTSFNSRLFQTFYRSHGYFPFGRYRACVEILTYVGLERLEQTCFNIRAGRSFNLQLAMPLNQAEVTSLDFLSWLPIAGIQGVSYQMNLVEVLERQTPEEAIRFNPSYIAANDLKSNLFPINPGLKPLVTGNTYAWQVKGTMDGQPLVTSEVWSFKVVEPDDNIDEDIGVVPVAKSREMPRYILENEVLHFKPEDRLSGAYELQVVEMQSNRELAKGSEMLGQVRGHLSLNARKVIGKAKGKDYLLVLTDTAIGKKYYLVLVY